ncbi:MAG: DUF2157 domain-containing protein [Methylococcaceae bacterium]|nr:DUF2157 domain-containing protein [Methylococcaceae bacterium]
MDTKQQSYTLEQIPANRRLIEVLYANGKITSEAKKYALNLLYPHKQWGLWVSRLMLIIGTTLMLSGIIYFFAFNWSKITPVIKLSSIQIAIFACLIAAYLYSLQRLSGQVLLLCASVLVGVFMAVFGQIYQTGADAYQLFMMWSLFTLGWTIISNFSAQWIFWLVITNTFLVLWWDQAALPSREMKSMIFTYMMLVNGIALALREYFALKGYEWLQEQWTRVLLIFASLLIMLIPIIMIISEPSRGTESRLISSLLGLAGHIAAYIVYRHKLLDMWALATTILSACIILEVAAFKVIIEVFDNEELVIFFLTGVMTLAIFTSAIIYLRKIATHIEVADHV